MINNKQRIKDLRLLSAYLDGELREPQRRKLEMRLTKEEALREQLENLRKTQSVLGRLPRVSAPRNFTLTPEMVTVRRKRQPLFTALRWTTPVAAILMVVLFSVELLTGGPFLASRSQSAVLEMDESAPAEEASPEPLILWGAPGVEGSGGGMGGDAADSEMRAAQEPMMEMLPAPEEEAVEATAMPQEQAEEGLTAPMDAEEESLEAYKSAGDSPILGINTDQGGDVISTSEDATPPTSPIARLRAIRWAEIALAVIAAGGGIALLILRKR